MVLPRVGPDLLRGFHPCAVRLPCGEASLEPGAGSACQPDKTLENEWAVVFGIRHPVFWTGKTHPAEH